MKRNPPFQRIDMPVPTRNKSHNPKITDLTAEELTHWTVGNGHKPFRARQLFQWIYLHRVRSWEEMSNLSKSFRREVAQSFSLDRIAIVDCEKAADGTLKLLQELGDGNLVESVLMDHGDHRTLCLSTQVGCAMACRFCLTGGMGFGRNLSTGEIVDQVLNAYRLLPAGKTIRNIVYMGMGEPFHNYENTVASLSILLDPGGFDYSSRRVTVSTAGLVPEIRRFAQEENIKANLAVSLNGVSQETREELMPVGRQYPLEDLIRACRDFPADSRKRITFEYILMDTLTDSPQAAKKLVALLHGIRSKVNLIPYNESRFLPYRPSSERNVKRFQQYLLDHGIVATLRKSKGRGIAAACGQLVAKRQFGHRLRMAPFTLPSGKAANFSSKRLKLDG